MNKFIPIVIAVFAFGCSAEIQPVEQPDSDQQPDSAPVADAPTVRLPDVVRDTLCGKTPLSACGTSTITFSLVVPCNQRIVQIFVRRNGHQVAAQTVSDKVDFGRYCIYNYTRGGFKLGDTVEQRWFSFSTDTGIARHWPGPGDATWSKYVVEAQ